MRTRAGVIIIREGKMLLMRRAHAGREYYILPGGTIEKGETPEAAAVRELKEETGLDIMLAKKLFEHDVAPDAGSKYDKQYYFLAGSVQGEPILGGEEASITVEGNSYELHWLPLEDLPSTEIYHPATKALLLKALGLDH